jgi:hypothetical protein
MSRFETIIEPEKGIDLAKDDKLTRISHQKLINALQWVKGPIFLNIENTTACLDMFWISSLHKESVNMIVRKLRTDVFDIFLNEYDKRVLYVGPIFISLHYVVSDFKDLTKKNLVVSDFPLFGATIQYENNLQPKECLALYKNIRRFFEECLRKEQFYGSCCWGFLEKNMMTSNMFFFPKEKKMVLAVDRYKGEELDHLFYFELGDLLELRTKPKTVSFSYVAKGKARCNKKITRYIINNLIVDFSLDIAGENDKTSLVENFQIPFSEFELHIRPDRINFNPACPRVKERGKI